MVSDKTMPYLQRRPSRPNGLPRNWVGTGRMPPVLDLTQPAQGLKTSTFLPITIGVGSRCVLMRRECSGHAEGSNVVMEQPVDVMETAEGAVAELVTRAGDQWRLRLGTTQSVPVTAEYLLELMLQLRELRSRGIL